MEQDQLPNSIEEVESLLQQLYTPGAPEKVAKTQETLQRLQRSPQGWQLAQGLLGNQKEQYRFFGALTFIVKLNTDAQSLSEDDAKALLEQLVGFLVQHLANGEGALVVRKLCSALVAYFMQFSGSWVECVKHVMYCLYSNQVVPYDQIEKAPDAETMARSLSNEKAVAVLWFASVLVEEVGKTDSNSMKQHQFHRHIVPNSQYIIPLMSKYINVSPGEEDITVRQEALGCFQSWVSYSHRAFIDDHIILEPLQKLTRPTIMCIGQDDLYEVSVEIISDVLANYSKFLQKDDFAVLFELFSSDWAKAHYNELIQGDYDFESLQFGMLLIAFGDANVEKLTKNITTNPEYQPFLSMLCQLLSAEGYAVFEDKIFVPTLEFWNTYVENVLDSFYEDGAQDTEWLTVAKRYIFEAIERCLRKIQYPSVEEFGSWDSVDRTAFNDARRDVSDMLQQFYIMIGIELFDTFIKYANNAIAASNWAELEVAWYIIAFFCDSAEKDPRRDGYLQQIFGPQVLALFTNPDLEIPGRTKKAFLDIVSLYSDFFEKNSANLPTVLNIAFDSTRNMALEFVASKTIAKLCSSCRHTLLPELQAFLQQYGNITATAALDGVVKENVIQGIAALIEAIPEPESKLAPLDQLLVFVEVEVEQCLELVKFEQPVGPDDDSQAGLLGLIALKCLEGMAKGSRAPNESPVDLERSDSASSFWLTGNGSLIHQRIFSILNRMYDAFGKRYDIVEVICSILRKGFRELDPGPFVLPPEMAVQLFIKMDLRTSRLGDAMSTASMLIGSQKWENQKDGALEILLDWVSQLLQQLGEPNNDPEVAQEGIEFITRLLPKNLPVFLGHQPPAALEYLFMFTLKSLTGTEPLPKASAAEFWSALISLPTTSIPLQQQEILNNALLHLLPLLCRGLVYNIGGAAARSELDKLSDPIKKLVVSRRETRGWFEAVLYADDFPSDKVGAAEKKAFLDKIISLRGARQTNQMVKDFWLACRGSNFAYAS